MQDYPDSWYAATRNARAVRKKLENNTQCDVCVIGGGLAGLSCALELQRRGFDVVVLESGLIGYGASGRNAGLVAAGFAQDTDSIISHVGLGAAQELWKLSTDGVEYVRQQINKFDKQLLISNGSYSVTRINKPRLLISQALRLKEQFDCDLDHVDSEQLRAFVNTRRYHGALYDARSFSIHPLNYALALADAIELHGGRIFEHSKAHAITDTRNRCEVVTSNAQIKCQTAVLATSAYDAQLHPELARTILPVATYMAMTEELGDRLNGLLNTDAFVFDTRRAGDYYRKMGSRLLWGGRISTRRSRPAKVASMIAQDITGIFPQITKPPIAYSWYGLMGYSRHKMPLIYPLGHHLWMASAFGGHGLNTTSMSGQLVASVIARNDDRWKLFAAYKSPWAGGMVGRCAVQFSYWVPINPAS